MTDTLLITLCDQSYASGEDDILQYDTTAYGDLVNADIGYGVTVDGTPLEKARLDNIKKDLTADKYLAAMSSQFHERYCVTDVDEFSDKIPIHSGEIVSPDEYDAVLISHFWLYHSYLRFLQSEYPDVDYIGIMEEGAQDVMITSPRLQVEHYNTIKDLSGFITANKQYLKYVKPFVENAIHVPLPVPKNQFEGYPKDVEDRDAVCVGVGTFNLINSNIYTNVLVWNEISQDETTLSAEIIGIRDHQSAKVDALENEFDKLTIRGFHDEGLYDLLSEYRFAILMRTRSTAGRPPAEFAGLGVPCIGNKGDYMQSRCWPELSVDPHDTTKAVTLAKRLINDDKFYQRTIDRAQRNLFELQQHEHIRAKLEDYLYEVVG
jgi:hypothetical protein